MLILDYTIYSCSLLNVIDILSEYIKWVLISWLTSSDIMHNLSTWICIMLVLHSHGWLNEYGWVSLVYKLNHIVELSLEIEPCSLSFWYYWGITIRLNIIILTSQLTVLHILLYSSYWWSSSSMTMASRNMRQEFR